MVPSSSSPNLFAMSPCLTYDSSSFVDHIHSLNGNYCESGCNNMLGRLNHPVTSLIYITNAVLCILLSLVTHFKFNSVKVLNLTVRSNVISNVPWIAYFTVLFIRSVVGSVIYGITQTCDSDKRKRLMVYFITDGVLKSLELLCLSWALNHQWMYRAGGFLEQEINSFNADELSASGSVRGVMTAAFKKIMNNKAGTTFVAQFILAILFLILLEELNDVIEKVPGLFYWIYIAFFWTQCISAIVLVIVIAANKDEDGPTFMVKILFVVGVVFTLPADIPSFIWSSCMHRLHTCLDQWQLTGYDFALLLSIPSVIIFFIVLRKEFLRLDQEAQYSVIGGEVDSLFSVHSETIAES